jgi:CheY-like chemotaxis protein/anti-sigma regulatory factor (Ser/Thr protein kinase)
MSNALHILVVEDDEIVVGLIEQTLAAPDFRLTVAADGEAAWECLQGAADFDAVLLDRGLPKLDGLSLLKRIKADAALRDLPVVMETGFSDPESVRDGVDAGAYYYLTKPLYPRLLLSVLRAAVEQHRSSLTLQRTAQGPALALKFLSSGRFSCRTLAEACELASGLARACPDPSRAGLGLQELLVNAVEHGNLAISYVQKTQLLLEGRWDDEIGRRLNDPHYRDRVVTVDLVRGPESVVFTIKDEGSGFDWREYLELSPERAYDPNGRGIAMSRMVSFDTIEYLGNGNTVKATLLHRPAAGRDGSA